MKYFEYQNGDQMPLLGLGTWKSSKGEVYKAVKTAIELGYRHFDCAMLYGNEKEIGEALHDSIREGVVKREDLWITSKLWNNSHEQKYILPAIQTTLHDLQLDYLDLYLIHWPVALKHEVSFPQVGADMVSLAEVPLSETWQGMIDLKEKGLAKHIGVSNFSIKKIEEIAGATGLYPEVNQLELHPFLQQWPLVEFCKTKRIHMTGYCPLGSADRPANRIVEGEPKLFENQTLQQLALAKGCTTAQLMLAWAVNRQTSVIPKSVNAQRLQENLAAADIDLTEEEMAKIKQLDLRYRYIKGNFWCLEGSDYTLQNLWDE
ncbi:aldo/keto reductase [Runella zeae]|jgi:alcohol dehydrogenase (NADP+)|uniref:aldo/keto reductase n=1 Tax=Runella zeae TaxID=94255 RepID=UPI0004289D4B|nr:aldo/keto reductase [Runella zeae]